MNWIAVDWGTTNFRAWLVNAKGEIQDEILSSDGINTISGSGNNFEKIFYSKLEKWKNKNVKIAIMAGMIGSSIGWVDVPYTSSSVSLNSLFLQAKWPLGKNYETSATFLPCILPGIKLVLQAETNVLRGEEVQLLGFLQSSQAKEFNNWLICIPGTHSKWIHCKNEKIEYFKTHITGEIYELLCKNSILRFSTNLNDVDVENSGFTDGITFSKTSGGLLGKLFSIRSNHLLLKKSNEYNTAFLSGLMIGDEIKDNILLHSKHSARNLAIIANKKISYLYEYALKILNINATFFSAKKASLNGFYSLLKKHIN